MRAFTVERIVDGEFRRLPVVACSGADASRQADARKRALERQNDEGRRSHTPATATIVFRVPAASADERSPREDAA